MRVVADELEVFVSEVEDRIFVIDDPHSEQDAMSDSAFDTAYEWYTSGPRQRLQPGGSIIIVMTRWGKKDLTGRLIAAQGGDVMADKWDRPYTRERAAFPVARLREHKFWPMVGRIDNVHGDRNLVCTCEGMEAYDTD